MTGHVWWRIAWRNVWRNRKRTAITVGALAIGFVASTLMIGLSEGIIAQMIENGTDLLSGQIQVYEDGYKPERSLFTTIGGRDGTDISELLEQIDQAPGVRASTPRVYAGGLVSSGDDTSAGFLLGVDPQREPEVSRILDAIETGAMPPPGERQALLGAEMAEKLRVELGSEIVLVAAAADGSMGNDVYTVSGTFRTGSAELDGTYAILRIETLQALAVLDANRVHEVTVAVDEPWNSAQIAESLESRLRESVEVRAEPWTDFRPDLAEYALLAGSFNWVIVMIVFVMAIFGVANTMLMATWERRREFAVVRALGSPSSGVIRTVVLETMMLGAVSLVVGLAISVPLMFWWSAAPPDLSWLAGDFTMAGVLVQVTLRVQPSLQGPLLSATGLMITVLLAGLYPALRSARQSPADILAGAD